MKLLLDEMHAPAIAVVLRDEGWDVTAVAADRSRRGSSDEDILNYSAGEDRALVTENIGDFMVIAARWAGEARRHAGLIYTSPKRFNRASVAYPGSVIVALRALLSDPPDLGSSGSWWL